jgi:hypothetical protein
MSLFELSIKRWGVKRLGIKRWVEGELPLPVHDLKNGSY